MALPNLLVIGATKAGTTTLWHYLNEHPQIHMAPGKELHFFDLDANWARGLDWYADHFRQATDERVVGEATPGYTRFPLRPAAASRAAATVPGARLIYLVRDPVERVRSHVIHEMRHGREHLSFAEAVLRNPMYVEASCYAMQAARWLEHYPRESLLIVESERLHREPTSTLREIYAFLDVAAEFESAPVHLNNASVALRSSPRAQHLREHPGVRALTTITPRSLRARVKEGLRRREHAGALDAEITPQLREQIEGVVRPDVAKLAALMPTGFAGWDLLPDVASIEAPAQVSKTVASTSS